MSMKPNKNLGAQQLLDSQGYGAWLTMVKRGLFSNKQKYYCVLHGGHFYYFKDATSKVAKGVFPLFGYSASEGDGTKDNQNVIKISSAGINKVCTYTFAAGSSREQQEWISTINKEIDKSLLPPMDRGVGDGEDCDDSDGSYDYTTEIPDDISFSHPENLENLETSRRQPAARYVPPSFEGPRFVPCDDEKPVSKTLPKPPPRSDKPNLLGQKSPMLPTKPIITALTKPDYRSDDARKRSYEIKYDLKKKTDSDEKTADTEDGHTSDFYVDMSAGNEASNDGHYENPNSCYQDLSDDSILPASVFKGNLNRDEAEVMLQNAGAIGLYLIRQNRENKQVLCVFGKGWCKHYIIFQQDDMMFLGPPPEPQFTTLGHLIRYYMMNNLPTSNNSHQLKLSKPYSW